MQPATGAVGKNMTAIEYKDEIIVIDAGIQFKTEETPGIDYMLPNTKYLEARKGKIKITSRVPLKILHSLIGTQIILGVLTLIYVVPIPLASLHQMVAVLILVSAIYVRRC